MSASVNKCIIIGHVGDDPKVKRLTNGNAVANLTIATDESYKDKATGETVAKTEWHRIVFFNKLAEVVEKWIKKGAQLYIEGSLRTRTYEKNGATVYITEILGRNLQMLDSKGNNTSNVPKNQADVQKNQAKKIWVSDPIPF